MVKEGGGVKFFFNFFFSLLSGYEGGGQGFFYFIYVEGGWEGEGVDFFYKFIMGGGEDLVGSSHFQNKKHS